MMFRSMMAALIGLVAFGAGAAKAQEYPDKPIGSWSASPPAASPISARGCLADHITRETGQPAVVENRSAAAGTIASPPSPRRRPTATRSASCCPASS